MNVLLINYILMLVEAWGLLYKSPKEGEFTEVEKQNRKKLFIIVQCVQWVLLSTLRSYATGADTANYSNIFESHSQYSWAECFELLKGYYLDGLSQQFEPGFILFEILVSTIWYNQTFYKFSIAAVFMPALGHCIYKNSDDPVIAFMLYSGMFYNLFSLTGYRQVISVAIGVLWAYEYVKQRKFFKFLMLVLLGAVFHKSTLVFLVFYFISRKKITAIYGLLCSTAIMFMIVFRTPLFMYVKGYVGYDEYGLYGAEFTQRNFLILFSFLSVLAIWRYRYVVKLDPDAQIYYNGLILSASMIPFAMVSPTSMRLVYVFGFTYMIMVPKIYQSFSGKKDHLIAYAFSILIFGFFIATRSVPYEFFWQAT